MLCFVIFAESVSVKIFKQKEGENHEKNNAHYCRCALSCSCGFGAVRLHNQAERHGQQPGWFVLTGQQQSDPDSDSDPHAHSVLNTGKHSGGGHLKAC